MTYNGFAYSRAAVQNGQYSFWSYERLFLAPTFTGVAAGDSHRTVVNALAARILNFDAVVAGTQLSTMNVQRATEGAPVY